MFGRSTPHQTGSKRKRHIKDVAVNDSSLHGFGRDASSSAHLSPNKFFDGELSISPAINGAGDRHAGSTLDPTFAQMPLSLTCEQILSAISDQLRQYLCTLYKVHFNDYIQLLSTEQLRALCRRNAEPHDKTFMLLQIAAMAIGLLHADRARQDVVNLQPASSQISFLHRVLKDVVETSSLCEQGITQLPIVLLLSELERAMGRVGAAAIYLREAVRVAEELQPSQFDISVSDEEILCRRSYVRACEFIRQQWDLFGHVDASYGTQKPRRSVSKRKPEQLRMQSLNQDDTSRSIYFAHLELLRIGQAAIQSLQAALHTSRDSFLSEHAAARRSLNDWFYALPGWMNRGDGKHRWPGALFFLHQQYFTILVTLGTFQWLEDAEQPNDDHATYEECTQLLDLITDYAEIFGATNAPLVLAFQAETAVRYLLNRRTNSAEHHTDFDVMMFQKLQVILKTLSQTYRMAGIISERVASDLSRSSIPQTSQAQTNDDGPTMLEQGVLSTRWSNLDAFDVGQGTTTQTLPFVSLSAPNKSVPYEPHYPGTMTRHTTNDAHQIRDDNDFSDSTVSVEKDSVTVRSRDAGEERLVLISDPVFCAYVDEVSYIVGQYGSPKDQQNEQAGAEAGTVRAARNSPSKDAIEQLRVHLGQNIPPNSVNVGSAANNDDYGGATSRTSNHNPNLSNFMLPPVIAHL